MPVVSIIMCSYNHAEYIGKSIESILAQTITDIELIVIDDASSDNSREVIQKYQQLDNRVRPIFHPENKGISITVNDGLDAATGKYVGFNGSDDIWLPHKLEVQLKKFEENEDVVVWAAGDIINREGTVTGNVKEWAEGKAVSGDIFESLVEKNYIFGQTRLVKRENIKDIRFSTEFVYLNDWVFDLELALRYPYVYIDESLAQYRIHGENSITRDRKTWDQDNYHVRRYLLRNYPERLSPKVKARCYYQMGRHLHNRRRYKYARKCFLTAIKNDRKKTSYYKKFMKLYFQELFNVSR